MKFKIFVIHDNKASAFNQPFFLPNEMMAKRAFKAEVDNVQSTINQSPEDYSLHEIGEFDDSDASFEVIPQSKLVCTAVEIKNPTPSVSDLLEKRIGKMESAVGQLQHMAKDKIFAQQTLNYESERAKIQIKKDDQQSVKSFWKGLLQ